MVTSVASKHSTKAPRPQPKMIRVLPQQPSAETISDTRQRLGQTLQMSLDIEDLLQSFFELSRKLIDYNSLEYRDSAQSFTLHQGRQAAHSCDYQLHTGEGNLGSLAFTRNQRFLDTDMALIETLIGSLIYPLRNALRYRDALQTALTDPLTGTGNRVAMDNALRRELQLVERYNQDFSMLVIDIDHFKQVNDTYGHSCGDRVLCEVAATIESVSRGTDMCFRYGGEEFVLLLSKTAALGAGIIAERIRQFVERLVVPTESGNIKTSISIGVSTLQRGKPVTDLFERADKALYQAKESGRNCVVCASKISR